MEAGFDIRSDMPSFGQTVEARALAISVPTIASGKSNADALELFNRHRELISLPVLEGTMPIGLISRNIFMSQMSKPYYRELYEKKTCIAFMDKDPLIVDARTTVDRLAELAVQSGDKTLADGFLITADDQFQGFGSGLDLMRKMVELQTEKNRQVMQSIDYASTIQQAMLSSSRETMRLALADAGLVWEPRDIVGGDFYHFERTEQGWFAALADCTGHGVPGAFLTVIASSALKQALERFGPNDPARLMGEVNCSIKSTLGQSAKARLSQSDDGMDAAFFFFNQHKRELTSANARVPLFYLSPASEEITLIAAERNGLGYVDTDEDCMWQNTVTPLPAGTILFGSTDGLWDQIGGPKQIAFGKQRIRQALLANRTLSMQAFTQTLMHELHTYQGTQQRRDDLACFAFRL